MALIKSTITFQILQLYTNGYILFYTRWTYDPTKLFYVPQVKYLTRDGSSTDQETWSLTTPSYWTSLAFSAGLRLTLQLPSFIP